MDKLFYLCGGITGISTQEASLWRTALKIRIEEECSGKVRAFNPLSAEPIDDICKVDSVTMRYELDILRRSSLVICYFNNPASLGSMAELAIAYERRIPILGINPNQEKLHPWQIEMCDYIFNNMEDFWEYLKINYLGEI